MELLQALMNSQNCDESTANQIIADMREQVNDGEDPEDVLSEFGLEPDYVMDLID